MFPIVILVHEETEDFSGSELSSGSDAEVSLAGTDAGFGKKLKKGFKKTTKKVAKAVNPCPNKDYHVNLCLFFFFSDADEFVRGRSRYGSACGFCRYYPPPMAACTVYAVQ